MTSVIEALRLTALSVLRGLFDAVNWTRLHAGRVAAKSAFFGLSVWAIATVQLPLEEASWRLWLSDQALASRIALWVVATSSLVLLIAGYSWAARRRALASACYVFAGLIITLSLVGVWNRLLYEQHSARAAVAAIASDNARIAAESGRASQTLIEYDRQTAEQIALWQQQIGLLPVGSVRSRERILERLAKYQTERAAGRAGFAAPVPTESQSRPAVATDPRPVDRIFGRQSAETVAVLFDLLRAITLKIFVIIAFPLALAPAPEVVAERRRREAERQKRSDAGKLAAQTKARNRANLPTLLGHEEPLTNAVNAEP